MSNDIGKWKVLILFQLEMRKKVIISYFLMWIYDHAFCCEFGKTRFKGGPKHRGEGRRNLLQYYTIGGGSLGTSNLYYVIYGGPNNISRAKKGKAGDNLIQMKF